MAVIVCVVSCGGACIFFFHVATGGDCVLSSCDRFRVMFHVVVIVLIPVMLIVCVVSYGVCLFSFMWEVAEAVSCGCDCILSCDSDFVCFMWGQL